MRSRKSWLPILSLAALVALAFLYYRNRGDGEPAARGDVTVHAPDAAWSGLNLYVSGHGTEAFLIDMDGNEIHRWSHSAEEAVGTPPADGQTPLWRRAVPLPGGHLLAIRQYSGVMRLDADSNVVWSHAGRNHHDLDIDAAGNVYVLGQRDRLSPDATDRSTIVDDTIVILDPAGQVLDELSIQDCFARSVHADLLDRMAPEGGVFHTNTLTRLDGGQASRSPAFAEGNLLVSVRELDVVAIIDPVARMVVWAVAGPWKGQHEPVLMESGALMVFDNDPEEEYSRVIEIDPFSGEILWQFGGDETQAFHSPTGGSAQRLPNGNTLIVESTAGRAFEITPAGDVVWEFVNPHRAGRDGERIGPLFDVVRLPVDYMAPSGEKAP